MIKIGPFVITPHARFPSPPDRSLSIVEEETVWRVRPAAHAPLSGPKVVVTRWRSFDNGTREVSAETPSDRHLVSIVLRNENVRLSVAGRIVHDGPCTPGMLQVTEPGAGVRCVFRGPYDVLHLHVPNSLIASLGREGPGSDPGALRAEAVLIHDPIVERLARALLAAEEIGAPFCELYVDCISTAIVARLLASTQRRAAARPKVAELARWRLRRVIEYVEANLAEPVSLSDLALAAGLTRMHFAAQFRAATGLPPHEYLLRRRIERAQEMLLDGDATLVDIALSVGFQTQSHFTSVFKRFVGQPPRAWRQCRAGEDRSGEPQARWTRSDQSQAAVAA
jgi:AraC family transcriptional regulator